MERGKLEGCEKYQGLSNGFLYSTLVRSHSLYRTNMYACRKCLRIHICTPLTPPQPVKGISFFNFNCGEDESRIFVMLLE